jgi:hypothetical protein
MRPQDVVVLLKILCINSHNWMNKDLAADLFISPAEVSNSLQRSAVSGLLDMENKQVKVQALIEFLIYGLPFVFPQVPSGITRGKPTAHSHEYLKNKIVSNTIYVWPDAESNIRGMEVQPLYPNAVKAAQKDNKLYLLLAMVDVLRIGKAREKEIAINKLKKELNEPPN